ncbi:TIGR03643 family protein [Porifericola rhodea]|uniref:TIGR03643 family protein n=1 Tax=Porifericola rhodea TaxID=930972 RepID=UPI002666B990|nr:TIGR03643 family protein [Porifericola rhodea]WKN30955.1 TIGR03643 family protein [Porifericola rhodea]
MKIAKKYQLKERDIDRIVEMAWEDRTPFDAIESQFGVPEEDVIKLMRLEMKESSWKRWRKRVQGRFTKHRSKSETLKFKSSRQKKISQNKISKR